MQRRQEHVSLLIIEKAYFLLLLIFLVRKDVFFFIYKNLNDFRFFLSPIPGHKTVIKGLMAGVWTKIVSFHFFFFVLVCVFF